MTVHFPTLTARDVARALERLGFELDTQRGSHAHFYHPASKRIVTVPMHSGDIKRPLMLGIIKQSGFSRDEFLAVL